MFGFWVQGVGWVYRGVGGGSSSCGVGVILVLHLDVVGRLIRGLQLRSGLRS
jgi:hypothetical protein